jgi:hypothetical protein
LVCCCGSSFSSDGFSAISYWIPIFVSNLCPYFIETHNHSYHIKTNNSYTIQYCQTNHCHPNKCTGISDSKSIQTSYWSTFIKAISKAINAKALNFINPYS